VGMSNTGNTKSAYSQFNKTRMSNLDVTSIDEHLLKNVEIILKPEDKPWGPREFVIRTINGHRIMFGEEIKRE